MGFEINADAIPIENGDQSVLRRFCPNGSGYERRDYRTDRLGVSEYETPFDDAQELMSVEELIEAFRRQERERSSLFHVLERNGCPENNQGQLGYCHGFSPKGAMMLLRMRDGLDPVELSGSSVAAPAAGFRNAGANVYRDLKQASEVGFATTAFVPDRTTNQRDFKPGWKDDAARHRFNEFLTLHGRRDRWRSFHQQLTCAARNQPVCNGLDYWGHAVTDLRFGFLREPTGVRNIQQLLEVLFCDFWNSWGRRYGKNGVGRRVGRKMIADDAYAPTVPTPSAKR